MNVLVVLSLMLCASVSYATWQGADLLDLGLRDAPVNHFKLSAKLNERLEEMRRAHSVRVVSSANWDGFHARLILRDKQLYLTDLSIDWPDESGRGVRERVVPLPEIAEEELGLPCTWFTGDLLEFVGGGVINGRWRDPQISFRYSFKNGRLTSVSREGGRGPTRRYRQPGFRTHEI